MGIRVREHPKGSGKYRIYLELNKHRHNFLVGTNRREAEKVAHKLHKRFQQVVLELRAQLALGLPADFDASQLAAQLASAGSERPTIPTVLLRQQTEPTVAPPPEPMAPTFRKYAESWFDRHHVHWAPSTVYSYKSALRQLWPRFGALPINQITGEMLEQYVIDLAEKGLSKKTMRNLVGLMREVLEHAASNGHISRNPARGLRLSRRQPSIRAARASSVLHE